MQKVVTLWRTGGAWSSDFLKQAKDLSFNDKFDILLEKRLGPGPDQSGG